MLGLESLFASGANISMMGLLRGKGRSCLVNDRENGEIGAPRALMARQLLAKDTMRIKREPLPGCQTSLRNRGGDGTGRCREDRPSDDRRTAEGQMAKPKPGETNNDSHSRAVQSQDRREEVIELISLFVKAFDTPMTSGYSDDSAPKGVEREFSAGLRAFLKGTGSLQLEVRPFVFLWKDKVVYEDRDPEGVPNRLYHGGIRRFGLYPGISDWELTQLFNILKTSHGQSQGAPDLVSSLLDEDLPHLECVGPDDYFDAHPLVIPESLAELGHQYPRRVMSAVRQTKVLREYWPDSGFDFLERLRRNHAFKANGFSILNRLYLVTPKEGETINNQILRESDQTSTAHILETLIEVLLMEKSKKAFHHMVSFILGILDKSIKTGDYDGATAVLKTLYPCLRIASLDEWQKREIKKAIFDAGSEPRIQAIQEGITSLKEQNLEGLARYVSLLQRNAVPHLCRLLGELKGSKPRRIICDALADMGRSSIGVFGAFLGDERWYVVRNVVYILGRIGVRECISYLEKALDHPDPRVRREAVQAISKAASREAAIQYLTKKLDDVDGRIRGLAGLQLARIGREDVLGNLLDFVQSKAFWKREIREIRQFLEAIGITGSDAAVPTLSRVLVRKSFFGKIKSDEIRKSAANALGAIGTDEAAMALRKASQMEDDVAKDVSLAVLTRIGK